MSIVNDKSVFNAVEIIRVDISQKQADGDDDGGYGLAVVVAAAVVVAVVDCLAAVAWKQRMNRSLQQSFESEWCLPGQHFVLFGIA